MTFYDMPSGRTVNPFDVRRRIDDNRCGQCAAAMINGVYCHETGCAHAKSRFDAETGAWIRQVKCQGFCGYPHDHDEPAVCEIDYDDPKDTCTCGSAFCADCILSEVTP